MAANEDPRGWHKLFADPESLVSSINALGFVNSEYHAAKMPPPRYISTGTLVDLAPSTSAFPNNAAIYVYGSHREWMDEIRVKLNINDPETAAPAVRRFMQILRSVFPAVSRDSLTQVEQALSRHETGEHDIDDAKLSVRRHDFNNKVAGAHSLNMVFHRRSATLQD